MTFTAVIANNKGGVGKSNLTVQLAAALARRQRRVLVVDLDPQANSTRRLGITVDPDDPIVTTSEVVKSGEEGVGEGAVVPAGWRTEAGEPTPEAAFIDVLPARFDLINREGEAAQLGAVKRLKKTLRGWTTEYDVTLIDTRPDLGHLVQMAMAAADSILIPTDPTFDSIEAAIRKRGQDAVEAAGGVEKILGDGERHRQIGRLVEQLVTSKASPVTLYDCPGTSEYVAYSDPANCAGRLTLNGPRMRLTTSTTCSGAYIQPMRDAARPIFEKVRTITTFSARSTSSMPTA